MPAAGTASPRVTGTRGPRRPWRRAHPATLGAALGAALAVGSIPLLALPARAATGTITAPDRVVTEQQVPVSARVTYDPLEPHDRPVALVVTDPQVGGGCHWRLAQGQPADPLAQTVDLAGSLDVSAYPTGVCGDLQGRPVLNGVWHLSLEGAQGSRDLTVAVAPVPPAGVASAGGAQQVIVTWKPNPEPDTHAYDVIDGGARVGGGEGRDLCDAAGCRLAVAYPAGGTHQLAVRALRRSAPPTAGAPSPPDLVGPAATAAPAEAAPPAPGAGPTGGSAANGAAPGSGGPGSVGPSAGSTAAGAGTGTTGRVGPKGQKPGSSPAPSGIARPFSTAGGRRLTSLFDTFGAPGSPLAGLPPLPASLLPQLAAPSAGPGEPLADGTFSPTLGYRPGGGAAAASSAAAVPLASVADAVGVNPYAFWRSVAVSALLLLAGAHLRRWARSGAQD